MNIPRSFRYFRPGSTPKNSSVEIEARRLAMQTLQMEELLRRIKTGIFDPADVEILEQPAAVDFLAELDVAYPFQFQERRLRDKWEVSLARSLRHEIEVFSSKDSLTPLVFLVPVFRGCLFLSGEGNFVTGIAATNCLSVKPIRKPFRGLSLTTGRGFKLDRSAEGWSIKPVVNRTVRLTEDFLKKRGWRFDVLWPFSISAGNRRARPDRGQWLKTVKLEIG